MDRACLASSRLEDPQPSTSRDSENLYHPNRRQSEPLPLQPRIRQYEPNVLLQKKTDSGITELDRIFQERELLRQQTIHECETFEVPERPMLMPRGPTFEQAALLAKNSSGLSEIESYLKEKERELNYRRSNSVGSENFHVKLQPRNPHAEINPLLQRRDSSGRSEIERLLAEKEQEMDWSTDQQLRAKHQSNHPIQPKLSIKKVHFERTDSEETGLQEAPDKNSDKKSGWRIGGRKPSKDSKDTDGQAQDNGPKDAKGTNNNKKSTSTTQSNTCCAIS